MKLPENDSAFWPTLRVTLRQAVLLVAFMLYYQTGLEGPDFKTMASLLCADGLITTISEKLKTK